MKPSGSRRLSERATDWLRRRGSLIAQFQPDDLFLIRWARRRVVWPRRLTGSAQVQLRSLEAQPVVNPYVTQLTASVSADMGSEMICGRDDYASPADERSSSAWRAQLARHE